MHTCSMAIGDRDPLREKRLSMNERLDSWGESQKAARKNLPKMRARTHRSYRHQVKTDRWPGVLCAYLKSSPGLDHGRGDVGLLPVAIAHGQQRIGLFDAGRHDAARAVVFE